MGSVLAHTVKTRRNVSKISIPTAWPAVTPGPGTVAPRVPRFASGVMYFNTAEPTIPAMNRITKIHCFQTSVSSIFNLMQNRLVKRKELTRVSKKTQANDRTKNVSS